jgi:DNA (cytosine-5)-methyltransferase 1
MREPVLRARFDALPGELVVDGFAGGGGTSTGIVRALGKVDIAINHDPIAIHMHRLNHPDTKHYVEDIFDVNPTEACAGRPVGFAWFSPDCTHFSRAKWTVPLKKEIRGLAWVVVRWAEAVRPRIIVVENVEEFQTWGPLDDHGRPVRERAGETFAQWVSSLRALGYEVQWRSLVAADFGAPTTRRRLFMIARCDGEPIAWPEPTHGRGRARSWRAAAEVIDWSLPCPSIFTRRKPLKPATLKRIAKGIERFVIGASRPFIVSPSPFIAPLTHGRDDRVHSIAEPVRTVTAANRGELALVTPFLVRHGHYSTKTGAGLREGCGAGTFRGQSLGTPLGTVCATNDKHLVVPMITKHYGGVVGHQIDRTLGTVTAKDHHALTAAFLTKFYGTSVGSDPREPMPTVTGGGGHIAEVRALLESTRAASADRQAELFGEAIGMLTIAGERYVISDIGMRMLAPHELFAAQGFPDDYVIDFTRADGKRVTKTEQTHLAGNAVPPQFSEALARANVIQREAAVVSA